MSVYNKKAEVPTVTNLRGGTAYKQSDEVALVSLMATGLTSMFHEPSNEREKRLIDLIHAVAKKDLYLTAQMIVYARAVLGQRTVTHRAAVELAKGLSGETWAKNFFTKRSRKENKGGVIYRLDDMLEIAACYFALNPGKALSNPMKKGFRSVLETADAYELAKYKGTGKVVSLVDMVNLLHPKGEKNAEALKALVEGTLKQFNTAEDKNTEAGQKVAAKVKAGVITQAEAEVELKEAKAANWKELIETRKIGYLALLRNLRNIVTTAPELVDQAGALLTDKKFVRESLVFPHQIDLAIEELMDISSGSAVRKLIVYADKAYELATENVKELFSEEGETAIVIDSSGSMTSRQVKGPQIKRHIAPVEKSALIAATLAKGIKGDVFHFAYDCQSLGYNPNDSVNTLKNQFLHHCHGGTTNFDSIFKAFKKPYARVFIMSDMQGADALNYRDYKSHYNCNPYIYSIDLCGHGTSMFKQNDRLFSIAGYSAQVYETAKLYETDYNALLNEIRKIII